MIMNRGEIWLVQLNPSVGSEIHRDRHFQALIQ